MNLELKIIDDFTVFIPQSSCLWLNEQKFQQLFKAGENRGFIKVISNNSLERFIIYEYVQELTESNSSCVDNQLLIPKELLAPEIYNGFNISVEPAELEDLPVANEVIIQLNEKDVEFWSEDDVEFAKNSIATNYDVINGFQHLWIYFNPNYEPLKGKRIKVDDEIKGSYRITGKTKIHFEGLPENKQKVVDFNKIGGLNPTIQRLRELVQIPLAYPELFEKYEIQRPKGILLYGPPGNGKTMIARALSNSFGARFFSIQGPEILSKFVGDPEKKLKEIFSKASRYDNSIVFIDEIDSIASSRDNATAEHSITLVSALLNVMDGISSKSNVLVIGATNRIDSIDTALRRPGRFGLEFEIALPTLEQRIDILKKYIDLNKKEIIGIDESYLNYLGDMTNGFTGADIYALYRTAVINNIRNQVRFDGRNKMQLSKNSDPQLKSKDFEHALKYVVPTMKRMNPSKYTVDWEDIIGLDNQKKDLLELQKLVEKLRGSDFIKYRSTKLNILVLGRPSSGKDTLIRSFANKFEYQLFDIDPDNESYPVQTQVKKAIQVFPSLLFFKGWGQDFKKTWAFLDGISSQRTCLLVVACEEENIFEELKTSGCFGTIISTDVSLNNETLKLLLQKNNIKHPVETMKKIFATEKLGIGQLVQHIHEYKLLNQ